MSTGIVRAFIALMLVAFAQGCSAGDRRDNLRFNQGEEVLLVNDIGIETYESGCNVPVCISPDVLARFYWAVKDGNSNEIFDFQMHGSTVNIDCSTRARVQSLYQDIGYKVYILEGQQYGREFWVYYELLSKGG
jgi:hypothetical protein